MIGLSLGAIHRWWATTAGPVLDGRSAAQRRLTALHAAPGGACAPEWVRALRPALAELFTWAYPYQEAHGAVLEAARVYAAANGYDPERARAEGEAYARMNTDANLRVSAAANAEALAGALGAAFAAGDAEALRRAYPEVLVRAVLLAAPQAHDALVAGLRAQGVTP
ncbi:hypothetical protein [Dactylosporangium sp. CA-092794]|uniref:hypothetical protein n=1 Tax=Dactylosporangium sp. CA-092794 TaxID=3239929 RepID=UPI003D8EBBBD